jgi:hypothetical protein
MSDDIKNDDTRADIDPRFDPAFQRGFDPATPVRERVPAASRPSTPVSAPVAQPTAQPTPPRPAQQPPIEPPVVSTLDADETAAEIATESSTTRNPYLLLLAVVAVILVAVGVWLFVQSGAQFNTRAILAQGDYMSLEATIQAAPFVSLLGAATAIGVVFVFAAQWRKRR